MTKIISKAKFLLLFGALSLFVFISSCSEDEEPAAKSDLIGLWTIDEANVDATIGGQSITDYFINVLGASEIEAGIAAAFIESIIQATFSGTGTIDFKDNNTYFSNIGGEIDDGTWSVSSDGKTVTLDAGTVDETTVNIISLSGNTLKISFTQVETEDIDDNPATPDVAIDILVEMTLTK